MEEKNERCANCGMTYSEHGDGTDCLNNKGKWFPGALANAIRNSRTENDVQVAEGSAVVDYDELAEAFRVAAETSTDVDKCKGEPRVLTVAEVDRIGAEAEKSNPVNRKPLRDA